MGTQIKVVTACPGCGGELVVEMYLADGQLMAWYSCRCPFCEATVCVDLSVSVTIGIYGEEE